MHLNVAWRWALSSNAPTILVGALLFTIPPLCLQDHSVNIKLCLHPEIYKYASLRNCRIMFSLLPNRLILCISFKVKATRFNTVTFVLHRTGNQRLKGTEGHIVKKKKKKINVTIVVKVWAFCCILRRCTITQINGTHFIFPKNRFYN